ncbi:MAG: ABC transporter ATP-binding protein [Tenericutes bacterium]|nr:ABC transporter ATP-binding protein [Mycoplasmatota bacterium]
METVIQIKDLKKDYNSVQKKVEVLKGINLTVKEGEFISIMGPSGSGKSTLLYLMGGLETPTEGTIHINNENLSRMNDNKQSVLRSNIIGYVFQFYNLVEHLNVEDNILLPVLINGGKKKDFLERLIELLTTVGLLDKRKSYPRELSGGEQQRVSIARSLINSPLIILADEPIGNLDSKSGKGIMELFKDINKTLGTTIIQVTHSHESAQYGNRIVNVKDGILV